MRHNTPLNNLWKNRVFKRRKYRRKIKTCSTYFCKKKDSKKTCGKSILSIRNYKTEFLKVLLLNNKKTLSNKSVLPIGNKN